MSIIRVDGVSKEYKVYQSQTGTFGAIKSFFKPSIKYVQAIKDMSFEISEGEFIGFIGENGAGKSTMIKMMSGILFPTSGEVRICGLLPYKKRRENAMNIGVIFGQRTRLVWELPMTDTFRLYKEIYRIDTVKFKQKSDMFIEMLNMGDYVDTPVRQLSLGQRMRVEIALSLLHDPPVLFLDEPTIGLDVVAKKHIRDFFREQNVREGKTIILTSHDMKDLDMTANRIIMLTKGSLLFDGTVETLKEQYMEDSVLEFTLASPIDEALAKRLGGVIGSAGHKLTVAFNPKEKTTHEIISAVNSSCEVVNIGVKVPDIEDIVRKVYQ